MPQGAFSEIQLQLEKPKTLWVATKEIELSKSARKKVIAIVMNATTFDQASDIDYLMTNVEGSNVKPTPTGFILIIFLNL